MATKKAAPAKKAAAKPAAPKPIKETLSKSGLVAHIAEASSVAAKDVRAVLAALEGAIHGSVGSARSPSIPSASAISEAQRAPGTPREDPMKATTSAVDQPRPRKSERVTAPSRLARRAPEGASARGTCA